MRMILGVHSVCLVRVQFCCSVDLLCFVFFCQAFYILDELLVGGEIQESSKKNIIRAVNAQDVLQEVSISSSSMCLIRKKERKKRGVGLGYQTPSKLKRALLSFSQNYPL